LPGFAPSNPPPSPPPLRVAPAPFPIHSSLPSDRFARPSFLRLPFPGKNPLLFALLGKSFFEVWSFALWLGGCVFLRPRMSRERLSFLLCPSEGRCFSVPRLGSSRPRGGVSSPFGEIPLLSKFSPYCSSCAVARFLWRKQSLSMRCFFSSSAGPRWPEQDCFLAPHLLFMIRKHALSPP